jgi:hypothetical protein
VPLPENGEADMSFPGDFHADGYEPTSTSASRIDLCFEFLTSAKKDGAKARLALGDTPPTRTCGLGWSRAGMCRCGVVCDVKLCGTGP